MDIRELTHAIEAVSARYAARYSIERDVGRCRMELAEELGELTRVRLKFTDRARVGAAEAGGLGDQFAHELAHSLGQRPVLVTGPGSMSPRHSIVSGCAGIPGG